MLHCPSRRVHRRRLYCARSCFCTLLLLHKHQRDVGAVDWAWLPLVVEATDPAFFRWLLFCGCTAPHGVSDRLTPLPRTPFLPNARCFVPPLSWSTWAAVRRHAWVQQQWGLDPPPSHTPGNPQRRPVQQTPSPPHPPALPPSPPAPWRHPHTAAEPAV